LFKALIIFALVAAVLIGGLMVLRSSGRRGLPRRFGRAAKRATPRAGRRRGRRRQDGRPPHPRSRNTRTGSVDCEALPHLARQGER
jgi:hypothetical protein